MYVYMYAYKFMYEGIIKLSALFINTVFKKCVAVSQVWCHRNFMVSVIA